MGNNVKTKIIDGKTCVQTSFLSEIFGVSGKTLASWAKDGCPKADRGWWPVRDVIEWRMGAAGKGDVDLENLSLKDKKTYWEASLKKAQTENREMENEIKRGDYIEKEVAACELAAFFTAFKQAVLFLPRKIGIIVDAAVDRDTAKEVEKEVKDVVNDALTEWSRGNLSRLD